MREPWRRNQYVMAATVFVVFTGFAFVIPFLPLYVRELGVRDEADVAVWTGVLIGISPLLAGWLAPAWGRLADRHGPKRMALRALGAYVVLLVLTAFVTDVRQLLALRVLLGLFGGIGPLGLAMATSLAPRDQTGRAVGLIQGAQILSAAAGPLAGGFLADTIGIRATFLATALLCSLALALVVTFYVEGPPGASARDARGSFGQVLALPGVPALLAALFLVNFIGRSFTPILTQHLAGLGVPASRLAFSTGLLIALYSVAAALSAGGMGRATRSRPPLGLLVLSLLGGAAAVLPMAFVPTFGWMLAMGVLLGLTAGGSLTLCYTMGGLLVTGGIRATAYGFFSGAALIGGAVSPVVAGLLTHWDRRGIFFVDTALYVLLAAALVPALRGVVRPAGSS
jgi:DHA1 family multidrug resistance protein-like MFS transporter